MTLQLVSLGTLGTLGPPGMGWSVAGRAAPPAPTDAAARAALAVLGAAP